MRGLTITAATFAAVIALCGCGAGAPLSHTNGGSAPGGSTGPIAVGSPPSTAIERSVTAAYTVPTGKFLDSFEGVISRGVVLGGYVVSSSTQPDGTGRIVVGQVTMKVPSTKIAEFLNGMPSSFTASSINFSSTDHTADFVDVNARLTSTRAQLDALNGLLAKATSLGDITSLQQQIAAVQAGINTDQGQLNVLAGSVDFSSAAVQLSERGAVVAPAPPAAPLATAATSGWTNAIEVTSAFLEVLVTSLPFLVLGTLLWLVWLRFQRTTKARGAPQPPSLRPPA
jgi:hypothetical protein